MRSPRNFKEAMNRRNGIEGTSLPRLVEAVVSGQEEESREQKRAIAESSITVTQLKM